MPDKIDLAGAISGPEIHCKDIVRRVDFAVKYILSALPRLMWLDGLDFEPLAKWKEVD